MGRGVGDGTLMEHIHNNLIKLGGSLGNVPQNWKNLYLAPISILRLAQCVHMLGTFTYSTLAFYPFPQSTFYLFFS
jgi:hypothetical protein